MKSMEQWKEGLFVLAYFGFCAVFIPKARQAGLGMQGIYFVIFGGLLLVLLAYFTVKATAHFLAEHRESFAEWGQYMGGNDGFSPSRQQGNLTRLDTITSAQIDALLANNPYATEEIIAADPLSTRVLPSTLRHAQPRVETPDEEVEASLFRQEEERNPAAPTSSTRTLSAIEPNPARRLTLSPVFCPDVNAVLEAGIFVVGMKGSGKSYLAALIMEQLGRFPIPQVIYDIKGDYLSLVHERRFTNGVIMMHDDTYSPQEIIEGGLQVVVDLRSWGSVEEQALVMAQMNEGLMKYAADLPQEARVSWPVHLDEAQQWLAEQCPDLLTTSTWKRVTLSFANLGVLARSYGAVPCIYTQRIADIKKSAITSQELRIFMKASLDNDLDRYYEYLSKKVIAREQIAQFGHGDAVVVTPEGQQIVTRFYPRESKHNSHTPHITQALNRAAMRQAMSTHQRQPVVQPLYQPLPQPPLPRRVVQTDALPEQHAFLSRSLHLVKEQPVVHTSDPTPVNRRESLSPELQRAYTAYQQGHTSVADLQKYLGITHYRAHQLQQQLRNCRLIS